MSLVCETYCEAYENLFDQAPDLSKDQVMAGSDLFPLLLFPRELQAHYGDQPNFVEYVEAKFGLHDPMFASLQEHDSTAVAASDAVGFLTRLLEIVHSARDALPSVYFFRPEQTSEVYMELTVAGTTLQGGYNHCVAITGLTVEDLRGRGAYDVKGRHLLLVRESVADLVEKDCAAMLAVARTAQRFHRRFVVAVF